MVIVYSVCQIFSGGPFRSKNRIQQLLGCKNRVRFEARIGSVSKQVSLLGLDHVYSRFDFGENQAFKKMFVVT